MKPKGTRGRTIPALLSSGMKPKHQCARCKRARQAFARALARASEFVKGE